MSRHPIALAPLSLAVSLACALPTFAEGIIDTSAGPVRVDKVADGLDEPWAIAFLPDGAALITEREGRLWHLAAGEWTEIDGLPAVYDEGQGGLLDVMVPRDFAESREVWLTFAIADGDGGATAVGKGRLEGNSLAGFETLYHGDGVDGGRHFGSRLVEAADGTVFATTGDHGTGPDGMQAQDPLRVEGKVIHLNRDGTPATRLEGARPGVFSLGHRNMQGAALDGASRLWVVEHGAQGGDEVNLVEAGRNYGWPVISYGENYGGGQIGIGTAQPGMEQPHHYWVPSIAPSGLMIYQGDLFPEWRGDFFTGSLNSDFISRLDPDTGFAEERISSAETGRVRDVVEAPDGSIWFLSVYDGAIYRLSPAE